MQDLLPCPFCGGKAEINHWRGEWWVSCENDNCPVMAETLEGTSETEVIAAWNTRHERTCRLECTDLGYSIAPMCGECGFLWVQYRYCPNCGARVEP